jgi:hypothetical protein
MNADAIAWIGITGKAENIRDALLPRSDAWSESLREWGLCFSLWGTILETCGRCDDVYIWNTFYESQNLPRAV